MKFVAHVKPDNTKSKKDNENLDQARKLLTQALSILAQEDANPDNATSIVGQAEEYLKKAGA